MSKGFSSDTNLLEFSAILAGGKRLLVLELKNLNETTEVSSKPKLFSEQERQKHAETTIRLEGAL